MHRITQHINESDMLTAVKARHAHAREDQLIYEIYVRLKTSNFTVECSMAERSVPKFAQKCVETVTLVDDPVFIQLSPPPPQDQKSDKGNQKHYAEGHWKRPGEHVQRRGFGVVQAYLVVALPVGPGLGLAVDREIQAVVPRSHAVRADVDPTAPLRVGNRVGDTYASGSRDLNIGGTAGFLCSGQAVVFPHFEVERIDEGGREGERNPQVTDEFPIAIPQAANSLERGEVGFFSGRLAPVLRGLLWGVAVPRLPPVVQWK